MTDSLYFATNKLKSQSLIWNIYKNEDKEITFSVENSKLQ